MSPTIEQINDHGYIATFTGPLTLEQIADVRDRAAQMFAPDTLRWAVMDLRASELSNPLGTEEELDQIAKLHTVARDIKDVRTSALRLALVADEARFGTLVEIMVTATEPDPPPHRVRTRDRTLRRAGRGGQLGPDDGPVAHRRRLIRPDPAVSTRSSLIRLGSPP